MAVEHATDGGKNPDRPLQRMPLKRSPQTAESQRNPQRLHPQALHSTSWGRSYRALGLVGLDWARILHWHVFGLLPLLKVPTLKGSPDSGVLHGGGKGVVGWRK